MIRRDAPAPMLRRGPRPLLMHLMLNPWHPESSHSCAARSPDSNDASSSSKPEANARQSARSLHPGPDPAFLAGVAAYRRHPYARDLPDPPVLWQDGETRLLDYGRRDDDGKDGAIPALFVPSLINRGTILDLSADRSMLRWLADRGIKPLLLDWGWPGNVERQFDLTDYIARRLEPAIAAAAASHPGGRIILLGYCMGGLLAIAAALRQPERVAALGLIATPWDFHAGSAARAPAAPGLMQTLRSLADVNSTLSVDAIQIAFASLDPSSIAAKFRRLGALPQDSDQARLFVAIEDWLNDGVPLAGRVAVECLHGWYGENDPARGNWRVGGSTVDPTRLDLPTLLVLPGRDRIVPPESAAALVGRIRGAKVLELPGGHVGIVAGPRAPDLFWKPLLRWLRSMNRAATAGRAAGQRRSPRPDATVRAGR